MKLPHWLELLNARDSTLFVPAPYFTPFSPTCLLSVGELKNRIFLAKCFRKFAPTYDFPLGTFPTVFQSIFQLVEFLDQGLTLIAQWK